MHAYGGIHRFSLTVDGPINKPLESGHITVKSASTRSKSIVAEASSIV